MTVGSSLCASSVLTVRDHQEQRREDQRDRQCSPDRDSGQVDADVDGGDDEHADDEADDGTGAEVSLRVRHGSNYTRIPTKHNRLEHRSTRGG